MGLIMENFVLAVLNKKRIKLAFSLGLIGYFLSILLGINSVQVVDAKEFISSNKLNNILGKTINSFVTGYSLSSGEGRQSIVNIYVVGESRSGFVKFVFNKNEEGYALEKVYFDGGQVSVP